MRSVAVCALVLISAGVSQAQGLRIQVVDAESGKPIAGVAVERWASELQPRILRTSSKFWFPEKGVATDAEGRITIDTTAKDDWYRIKAKTRASSNSLPEQEAQRASWPKDPVF